MPADLDDVLRDASPDPASTPDPDRLWEQARRRRRRWYVAGAIGGVAAVAVLAVGIANLGPVVSPVIDDVALEPDPAPDDAPADAPDDAPDDPGMAGEPEPEPEPEPGPAPDPAAMDEPCAPHEDQFDEFGMPVDGEESEDTLVIDVVSPVDGQRVGESIELVGCARVYEATVRYRLLGPDGDVLVDDFTTATAGGPMIGAFRETVPVETTGALTLEVFWEDAADGGDRDLVAIEIVAE